MNWNENESPTTGATVKHNNIKTNKITDQYINKYSNATTFKIKELLLQVKINRQKHLGVRKGVSEQQTHE